MPIRDGWSACAYVGEARSPCSQLVDEARDRVAIALGIDQYTELPVSYRAAQPVRLGEPVDEWPEADPLDHAFDQNPTAASVFHLRPGDRRAHVTRTVTSTSAARQPVRAL